MVRVRRATAPCEAIEAQIRNRCADRCRHRPGLRGLGDERIRVEPHFDVVVGRCFEIDARHDEVYCIVRRKCRRRRDIAHRRPEEPESSGCSGFSHAGDFRRVAVGLESEEGFGHAIEVACGVTCDTIAAIKEAHIDRLRDCAATDEISAYKTICCEGARAGDVEAGVEFRGRSRAKI